MPHCLILGMTESGKTTLGKQLCGMYKARGVCTLVLDPLNDPGWPADFRTANESEFLEIFWSSRKCAAFIDEAGESVGRYNAVMHSTATRGRHWGHNCHYISQRGVQIAVTVRDQCGHLFLFCTAKKDAEIHANEWNCETLADASTLSQGSYFHVTRFGVFTAGNVFGKEVMYGRGRSGNDRVLGSVPVHVRPQETSHTSTDEGDRRASADVGNTSRTPADREKSEGKSGA
jgi:hypothetical protein